MEPKDAFKLLFRAFSEAVKALFQLLEMLLPLVGKLLAWIGRQISGSNQNKPSGQPPQPKPGRDIHVTAGPNDRVRIHRKR